MRYLFIRNPRAGTDRDRAALTATLNAFIVRHALDASVVETQRAGHATELASAASAAGTDVVVAIGGDGTMNETARALIGTSTTFGLIPRGSGNGLARHLDIPLTLDAALDNIVHGHVYTIDAGEAAGRLFFCAAGAGFDAAVLERFNTLPRRGFSAYLTAAAQLYFTHQPEEFTITVDDEAPQKLPALLIALANAAQFGNGAVIAPGADIGDGQLDLVVVSPFQHVSAPKIVARLFTGSLDQSRHIKRFKGTRFVIERANPGPMHVDGELITAPAKIEVRTLPGCLRILAP